MNRKLLAIYLNDHLAGATAGLELARRTAGENDESAVGTFITNSLIPEITEDRKTLEQLMNRLGIKQSRAKIFAAWALEKVGRLKLNGELRRYSPLSRLVELEGLAAGIDAKRALWLSLSATSATDQLDGMFDFTALAERANSQRARLEEHRLTAAKAALS